MQCPAHLFPASAQFSARRPGNGVARLRRAEVHASRARSPAATSGSVVVGGNFSKDNQRVPRMRPRLKEHLEFNRDRQILSGPLAQAGDLPRHLDFLGAPNLAQPWVCRGAFRTTVLLEKRSLHCCAFSGVTRSRLMSAPSAHLLTTPGQGCANDYFFSREWGSMLNCRGGGRDFVSARGLSEIEVTCPSPNEPRPKGSIRGSRHSGPMTPQIVWTNSCT